MKPRREVLLVVLAGIALLAAEGCTPDLAGATTETTNGVTGKVVNDDATPAINAIVKLLPSDFNPMAVDTSRRALEDTTDEEGIYRFSRIGSGTYTVIARKRDKATSFLKRDIAVHDDSVTAVPEGTLERSGSITADFSLSQAASEGYVYIPGTDCAAPVANNGAMVLDDVPAGLVSELLFVSAAEEQYNVLRGDMAIVADTTVIIEQPLWKHARRLVLNTSPSGAGVAGDVHDFPVLVRLDESTFAFPEADSGGEDLVFRGKNGNILPWEIERWDPAAGHAEVWVRVDTVYGNDSVQSLTMYWGNQVTSSTGENRAVFDSAAGYLGVWHLGDSGKDASPWKHDAEICTPAATEGLIGFGKKFSGEDSIKIATLLGKPQSLTLSAWASLDSTQTGGGSEILSIGDAALIRMDYALNKIGTIGSVQLPGDSTYFNATSGQYLKRTGWHFISFTVDHGSHTRLLYIDGVEVHSTTGEVTDSINYADASQNTFIGVHGNGKTGFNFIGLIDEVRVNRTALSADRLKLEYMNQKADDKLVVFDD